MIPEEQIEPERTIGLGKRVQLTMLALRNEGAETCRRLVYEITDHTISLFGYNATNHKLELNVCC